MPETRIIKRYANRKLYDTEFSSYVTLEQIAELIRQGVDVQIVDNTSKEDLTSVTLAQIIFEEEKKQRLLPLIGLRSIIQSGGTSIQDFVSHLKDDLDKSVGRVFRRDGAEGAEGVEDVEAGETAAPAETAEATPSEPVKTMAAFREFLESSQRRVDEWQGQIDAQIRKTVETLHPLAPLQKELASALGRIDALEARILDLEDRFEVPLK
jgi:polyhydroxyalkanoate synthesis repressor PhaR